MRVILPIDWFKKPEIKISALIAIASLSLWVMYLFYGELSPIQSALFSLTFTIFCAIFIYAFRYISGVLNNIFLNISYHTATIALSAAAGFIASALAGGEYEDALQISPITLLFGMFYSITGSLYYKIAECVELRDEAERVEVSAKRVSREERDKIDSITVKMGSNIHIIKVSDIVYIKATGDYVSIYCKEDRFIKDMTMKSLEELMPDNFVRVHRSYIVNANLIARVELYGKESYNLYLKNGECIKASNSGYKVLKSKMIS